MTTLVKAPAAQQAFPKSLSLPFAGTLSRSRGLDFASWRDTCLYVCFSAILGGFPASDEKVLTASHPMVTQSVLKVQGCSIMCNCPGPANAATTENSFIYPRKVDGWE